MPSPQFTPPTEPVEVDLGDGVKRFLRYNIATTRRLKLRFGVSMNGPKASMMVDEDYIAAVIWEGLNWGEQQATVEDPERAAGITIGDIEELPTSKLSHLVEKLNAAYFGVKKNIAPVQLDPPTPPEA